MKIIFAFGMLVLACPSWALPQVSLLEDPIPGQPRSPETPYTSTSTSTSISSSTQTAYQSSISDDASKGDVIAPIKIHAANFHDCMRQLGHDFPLMGARVVGDGSPHAAAAELCKRFFPEIGTIGHDALGGCTLPSFCEGTNCNQVGHAMTNVTERQCKEECLKHDKPTSECRWQAYGDAEPIQDLTKGSAGAMCGIHVKVHDDLFTVQEHPDVSEAECKLLCEKAKTAGANVVNCVWQRAEERGRPGTPIDPEDGTKSN